MKMMIIVSFTLLSSVSLSAATVTDDKCYVAKNTAAMTAEIEDDNDINNSKVQNVVRATLRLRSGKPKTAELKLKTASGVRATLVAYFYSDLRSYGVECDGGNMTLLRDTVGNVTVKTEYIRADIHGCDGTLKIATPGTKFTRVSCN